jgi:hypothetical protein
VIFTFRHYSWMRASGSEPRTQFKDPRNIAPAEKVLAFDSLTAHTGTYEIRGERFVTTRILAKDPNLTGRQDPPAGFRIEGNTLTIASDDGKSIVKLTRVE